MGTADVEEGFVMNLVLAFIRPILAVLSYSSLGVDIISKTSKTILLWLV